VGGVSLAGLAAPGAVLNRRSAPAAGASRARRSNVFAAADAAEKVNSEAYPSNP